MNFDNYRNDELNSYLNQVEDAEADRPDILCYYCNDKLDDGDIEFNEEALNVLDDDEPKYICFFCEKAKPKQNQEPCPTQTNNAS